MSKLLFLVIFSLFSRSLLAQIDSTSAPELIISGDIIDFSVDNLGNIYTLNKTNQLKKISPKGDSLSIYNEVKRYGKVYSIDVTNPLKLLMFYKDFGTIVVLDRFLTVINTLDLRKQGIYQASAISQSFDNGIWIYDEQEAKLKRMNDEGNIIDQTADFRQSMEAAPSPSFLIDQNRLVYLYDSARGVFVFDYFGTLKNKVSLLGWTDFQVIDNNVYGRKEGVFQRYQLNALSLIEQKLPSGIADSEKIRVSPNYLYSLKSGTLRVYALLPG